MIDIHSHIIYGVDDGPKTLDESVALITEAYRQGVRQIVATSHRRKGMFETPEEIILTNFMSVKAEVQKHLPDMRLFYGGELYYSSQMMTQLEKGHFPTMNGTRFALVEFSSNTPYKDMHQAVTKVSLLGLTPVLAHIERYHELAFDDKKVTELIQMGAYTQINSSHVLKPKLFNDSLKDYKKRVRFLSDKHLVHCVASDMHNLTSRPPQMKEAYDLIAQTYGQGRAQALFVTNPQTLLENQYI